MFCSPQSPKVLRGVNLLILRLSSQDLPKIESIEILLFQTTPSWNSGFGHGVPLVECTGKSNSKLKGKLLLEVVFLYIKSF